MEKYYEWILHLQLDYILKTIDMYLTIVFYVQLFPYLKLTTINMKRDTLIEHKEATLICENNGPKGL
jgi:hypothetical protein